MKVHPYSHLPGYVGNLPMGTVHFDLWKYGVITGPCQTSCHIYIPRCPHCISAYAQAVRVEESEWEKFKCPSCWNQQPEQPETRCMVIRCQHCNTFIGCVGCHLRKCALYTIKPPVVDLGADGMVLIKEAGNTVGNVTYGSNSMFGSPASHLLIELFGLH